MQMRCVRMEMRARARHPVASRIPAALDGPRAPAETVPLAVRVDPRVERLRPVRGCGRAGPRSVPFRFGSVSVRFVSAPAGPGVACGAAGRGQSSPASRGERLHSNATSDAHCRRRRRRRRRRSR